VRLPRACFYTPFLYGYL